ncbi:unnamed protein product [Ceutorhynchus assimilis]|uniref:Uncharacterized protein n=1 Tax=Ceutorhynchus assimilis TaxID=467358 RepID=A0A9N9MCU5_9CUCU|nr:unnamed protein product [Ceutorhynchus assimilis]
MEKEDEFLFTYFSYISQQCFDKSKEHVEKEKPAKGPVTPYITFLNFLQQLGVSEKNYMEIGFMHNKQKSFLRKDNSLRATYDYMKNDLKKIEDSCKNQNRRLQNYCQNITQFINARINLVDLYDKMYKQALSNKHMIYKDFLNEIETIIQRHCLGFTDITLTPMKAVFSLECEVVQQLFKAMVELQKLRFLPSLALVHGAHARLAAWENRMQKETWKLGLFKNSPLPTLFLWLQKLKGAVLSKFSLYFHDILANQTTPMDMRHLCSRLHQDFYQKMVTFQRKYEAACVILLSDNQVSCDTADYDSFPIIVSYPPRSPPQLDIILKMISDTNELLTLKPITKFRSLVRTDSNSSFLEGVPQFYFQDQCTYCLTMVEPNIYFVILFESKKSEKDAWIDFSKNF